MAQQRMITSEQSRVRLMHRNEVLALIGVSYPCLWGWVREGKFPSALALGDGKKGHVAWLAEEVEAWIKSRPRRMPLRPQERKRQ
jgi:predicted DNA-binding transcriptional regulator AlpA